MPLSEHEQRQLEQIEQALYADYPRFANAVRATDPRVHYKRRVIESAVGFLIGVGLLLTGVVIKLIPLGVAGFVVMLACSMWAVTSARRMTGTATGRAPVTDRGRATGGMPPGVGGLASRRDRGSWAAGAALAAPPARRP